MTRKKLNERFIEHTMNSCKKNGVKVILVEDKHVLYGEEKEKTGGYFSSDPPELAVATKLSRANFYGLLAHESSHMDQWIQNTYLWDKCSYGYGLFFEWLSGKIVKREHLEEAVQDIIRLELDCEIRAIAKIEKYKLPINKTDYIQKANTYLYSYLHMINTRKWISKPYTKSGIWKLASTRLKKKYDILPKRLERAFKKHDE